MTYKKPKPWEGYPAWYCQPCNMYIFYGVRCPSCKTEAK